MSDQPPFTRRQSYELLRSQLIQERASFIPTWRDIADHVRPNRPKFFTTDVNNGTRRASRIIDGTAVHASGTLRSGMMAGVTSPARPWFGLTTPDPDLSEFAPVKEWLHLVTNRMNAVFKKSNLYNVLPGAYGDMGDFGTSCTYMEEDLEDIVRFYPFPIGSYCIATDERLKVNVFLRDFTMTVRQLLGKFGEKDGAGKITNWANFSTNVKSLYDQNSLETRIEVCHVVRPNENYNGLMLHSKYKKFSSCYFERGASGNSSGTVTDAVSADRFLKESGLDFFPALTPRWEVSGEDTWGTTYPGINALGDIRGLQTMVKRRDEAVEKMVRPPMQAPASMRTQKMSILPGDTTFVPDGNRGEFKPSMVVGVNLADLRENIREARAQVQRYYFEDLFLMLSQSDRREITAREIDERREEKLLALGPVLEQMNQDALDPLIDNTFDIMLKRGQIPEAPEELQGIPLKIEYTSIMAQAQKAITISSKERFLGFVTQVAAVDPGAMMKVDTDELIDTYGDAVGIEPKVVRSDEQVAEMRQAQQQAQAQAQQAEQLQSESAAVKDLGSASTDENTALGGLLQAAQAGQAG